ncbi:MAG: 2-oxo acid dehydrogenase subunit E2 [Ardenticatenia bacterium]|nr:2-oxo acid dehydrogenase subunit E2 [Ardenticatenia bacterium]
MATEVVMPKMGYDMEEGTILRWAKHEGDAVAKGEVLGEIETGKVNIEIEAFDAGVLRRILVAEGQTVPVGTPIAVIGTADEVLDLPAAPVAASTAAAASVPPAAGASAADNAPVADPTLVPDSAPVSHSAPVADNTPAADNAASAPPTTTLPEGRLRASPLARRLAVERGVDLRTVPGTGPGGRVLRDDVLGATARAAAAPSPVASAVSAPAPVIPAAVIPAAVTPAPARAAAPVLEDRLEALSGIRRTVARRLSESWTAAPHIFVTVPVHMDAALALRKDLNAVLEARGGGKVSVNDLVVKAAALALRALPRLNVSWEEGQRRVHGRVSIGVAVALEDGLITVTVPDADQLPLSAIAADVGAKAERARAGKLQPQDLNTPSTFTISNLGGYGVEQFTAIINPPEAAILAVGAAAPEAVVIDGQVAVRNVMRVTLSADHRVVDGATAAEWLKTFRSILEQPLQLFDL